MLFAHDYNDNRVHIDDTHSNQEYYCPYCGAPLITKKGDIRQHHFAHKPSHECSDTWERNHSYDTSSWHNEWQSLFPEENQEVKLMLGNTRHRADVMIDRTVIEFQHSIMPVKAFDDRNNFYFNLGNKVVWLFDLSTLIDENQISFSSTKDGLLFTWNNPKKAFNSYDIQSGCIDLFFQLYENSDDCIVRVNNVSENGFEKFCTTNFMSKTDFLNYVGMKNGECLPPCREDIENDKQYNDFKAKYHITLNKQQERALLAVEGSNLLLAVPGSGKTTVLIARLGHMIINKNIPAEDILAITYNKTAAKEMRDRFIQQFGAEVGNKLEFRTINSFCKKIYEKYCLKHSEFPRELIEEPERRSLLGSIYKTYHEDYALDSDILELSTAITYIKNMMLTDDEIHNIETEYPHLYNMFSSYQSKLKDKHKMDFDDQMVYAHWILNNDKEFTTKLRRSYKYICVDEAQDTSKIQHEIIRILATGNNIFMVGDEDQSIYGYRAAYPKALLNFRYDYTNPYILRMERNYRSTAQIVEKAQSFISQNKGRYEKNMIAERGDGEAVGLQRVDSREDQYMSILEIAKNTITETAILYRDNESSVVLVDLFLRNDIPFKLRKPEFNFFNNRVVKDIVAYLRLSTNEHDTDSFLQVCNKGILYLKENPKKFTVKNCREKSISVFDALDGQMQYVATHNRDRSTTFRNIMKRVSKATSADAISILMTSGYENYLKKEQLDSGKIETLMILAKQEPNIKLFINRLIELENLIKEDHNSYKKNQIILSTIHSSKGLEYDSVYMLDVYDGRFPTSRPNIFSRSKDNADGEQEERRLFYVGITRAKNKLTLFSIKNRPSTYIDELFPEEKLKRIKEAEEQRRQALLVQEQKRMEYMRIREEQARKEHELFLKRQEEIRKGQEELAEIARLHQEELAKEDYQNRYNEIKDKFFQQDTQIRDSSGTRWIQCELCGQIKTDNEFSSYGGTNHVNLGICNNCSKK